MKIADKERKSVVQKSWAFLFSFFLFFLDIGSRDETDHIYTKPIASKFELFGLNNQCLHEVERGATVSVGDLVKIGGTHTFWSIVCKASDWNMKMISNTLQVQ